MFRILSYSRVRRPGWYLHGAGDLQAQVLQQGTAQHVRAAHEVVAAGPEHVEPDQRDRHRGQQPVPRPAGVHPPLQQGEVRPRTGQGDDLPVQDQGHGPGRGGEHTELGIGGSDVTAAPGLGPDPPVRDGDAGPQAVPLHLGHEPGGVRRQPGRRGGQHRLDETRAVPGRRPRHRVPPRVQAGGMPAGHASAVTGVLTWQYLP
jgi:hypothetical protein